MKDSRDKKFKELEWLAKLMDSQFRVPGTNYRFGLDGVIGLIPGVGDFSGLCVSMIILIAAAGMGGSGYLLARMSWNILLDFLIGSIPVIGDIFDFAYKANNRNMKLMQEHIVHGRYKGGAWKVVVPVAFLVLMIVSIIAFVFYKLFQWFLVR